MLNKAIARSLTGLVLLLAAIILGGCTMSKDAVASKVKQHLDAKYGIEFTIDAVGGGFGTSDNSTWKVIFHSSADGTRRSFATVPKTGGTITDYYLGVSKTQEYAESITSELARLVGARVTVRAAVNNSSDGETGTLSEPPSTFFAGNPGATMIFCVMADVELDHQSEDQLVTRIAEVVAKTAPNARVYLASVDSSTYDAMAKASESLDYEVIESKSNVWVVIGQSKLSPPERL